MKNALQISNESPELKSNSMSHTINTNIDSITPLITPREVLESLPADTRQSSLVLDSRSTIRNIIEKKDRRLLLVIGPCSIHDEKAALEYSKRLAAFHKRYQDKLYIIMRVYFEKPRTTVGWKGLINDPYLDGSYNIKDGLLKARRILLSILEAGVPTATEFLDPFIPQYLADLVSWAAIGARTTESQTHRQMASGLSMPVGFKNSTSGNTQVAVDAMVAARAPHHFLGIDMEGHTALVKTRGNAHAHMVLRGGNDLPNYEPEFIQKAVGQIKKANVNSALIIDCSHANSGKKHEKQSIVWKSIIQQIQGGNRDLIGMMLESNIHEGNQKVPEVLSELKYGVSITDACVNLETTEKLLEHAYASL